jgi:hypothetical protein
MATDFLKNNTTISVANTKPGLQINQTGSGEPIRIEDNRKVGYTLYTTRDEAILPSCDLMVKQRQVVETDAEYTLATTGQRKYSGSTIQSRWTEFNLVAADAGFWSVNAQDRIQYGRNSSGATGFISNTSYTDYVHDVILRSSNADDDFCGLVVCSRMTNNGLRTLSIVRATNANGNNTLWSLVYQFNSFAPSNNDMIVNRTANVTRKNPVGWSSYPGGVRIRVTKLGNIITCQTTDFSNVANGLNVPLNQVNWQDEFVFDLTTNNNTQIFADVENSFGYTCLSQDASTFEVLEFNDLSPIYHIGNGLLYTFNGNAWVSQPLSVNQNVGVGRFIYDQYTQKTFYANTSNSIISTSQNFDILNENRFNKRLTLSRGAGLLLSSPNGTVWKVSVNNTGDLIAEQT